MVIMLNHKNLQLLAVALIVLIVLYWSLGPTPTYFHHGTIKEDLNDGTNTRKDKQVTDKDTIASLKNLIQTMKSETGKMKVDFEGEKKALRDKYGKSAAQVHQMKQEMHKGQKGIKEKNNVLTGLEARILDISSANDKLLKENKRLLVGKVTTTVPFMGKKLVHLDLKGAPPKLEYLLEFMKYMKAYDADGFLIEYEDMFPWEKELEFLRSKNAYTATGIAKILKTAKDLNMIVVPLIQTFGHLEFLLKHKDFKHLRADKEITNVISPLNKGSLAVVKKMLSQVIAQHPSSEIIHLGGDEVYNLKTCAECKTSNMSDFELYTHHMVPIFKFVATTKNGDGKMLTPIIWDDMLRKWSLEKLKVIAQYVTPMVWAYVPDLSKYHNFPDGMWDRFGKAFSKIWIASSFKGALKPWSNFVPLKHHLDNHISWLKIVASLEKMGSRVVGVALTGWSRFDHYGPLCELLPAAIPSLVLCLRVLKKGSFDSDLHKSVSDELKFKEIFKIGVTNFKGYIPETADYPGGSVYNLIGTLEHAIGWYDWSNVRITGWTREYSKKRKFLSFFQLNTTLFGLNQSKTLLDGLKLQASDILYPMFDNDTVEEWIEDKIENYIKAVSRSISNIQLLMNQTDFA